MEPTVALHVIVKDGNKYIRDCLRHLQQQTYPHCVVRIFDNASDDDTVAICKREMKTADIIQFDKNYFVSGGFNKSLQYSQEKYVVTVSVDVMIDPHFVENAVAVMEDDETIGVVQAKVFYYNGDTKEKTTTLDTTGLTIYQSRRIVNRGHGEQDTGQYNAPGEIFCHEGAIPFFRRDALEDVKMKRMTHHKSSEYEYLDEDFVLYAEDLDLGWRIHLFGWKCWYEPSVVAWHDRSTTHATAGSKRAFIKQRKTIPDYKRMLDIRNQRLTMIKNDFPQTVVRHSVFVVYREALLFLYVLLFERSSLRAYRDIIRMAPLMLKKRKVIRAKSRVSEKEMRQWFLKV